MQGFVVEHFGDGECVVQFHDINVRRRNAGLLIGLASSAGGDFRIENILAAQFLMTGLEGGAEDANSLLPALRLLRRKHLGGRTIDHRRAALQQGQRFGHGGARSGPPPT
ncbi:hypothetical protein [Roseovarius sp. THAF27]|uniref:hypothetical protein n=1 Tax=Roseovarius sp. THAF27 TaxID=2587850 RepID=UPI001C129974|nr:hypothetical protein [Roseovarius sp. THAF27]